MPCSSLNRFVFPFVVLVLCAFCLLSCGRLPEARELPQCRNPNEVAGPSSSSPGFSGGLNDGFNNGVNSEANPEARRETSNGFEIDSSSVPLASSHPCAGRSADLEAELRQALGLQLDSGLSCDERTLVTHDLDQALHLRIQAPAGSYFEKAFSGTTEPDVMRYLSDRVRYVLSRRTDLSTLGFLGETRENRFAGFSGAGGPVYLVALNIGTPLWFEALTEGDGQAALRINGQRVPITSSRVGIIQLGEGYTLKDEETGHYAFSPIVRISTFVHEARHSDCTGGLSSRDLSCVQQGALPAHLECGHLHVICPPGHPYAGITACDDSPWGAYSIQAVFDAALDKDCVNCSNEDRIEAQAVALDALERVLIVGPMLDGQYGDPDMGSEGLR